MVNALLPQRVKQFLVVISGVILALYLNTGLLAATANYSVPWESKFTLPTQDENGWSIFTPSADSRIIYVSSTNGNDSTGQAYSINSPEVGSDYQHPSNTILPFRTIKAAVENMRQGYPDYVLLKRGDTFEGSIYLLRKDGRSATERSVVSWYGTATERPYIKTGNDHAITLYISNIAIVGLRFDSNYRNPEDPDFVGLDSAPMTLGIFAQHSGNMAGVLIEDCQLEWYSNSSIQYLGSGGGFEDIILRRNIIANNYSTEGHSQGLFTFNTSMLFEENLFYHNGWLCKAGSASCSTGAATMFNHNTYFTAPYDSIFRKNIYMSPSSINMKFVQYNLEGQGTTKGNILLDNNLLIDAEVGVSIAKSNDANDWKNFIVANNVIQQNGISSPTNRGLAWFLDYTATNTGKVINNVLSMVDDRVISGSRGLWVEKSIQDVEISNNKIYKAAGSGYAAVTLYSSDTSSGNTFSENEVISDATSIRLLQMQSTAFDLSDNTYYSTGDQSRWFSGTTGGTNTTLSLPNYVDPKRTIYTYLTQYGVASSMKSVYEKLQKQSHTNWNKQLTASVINDYIRNGFCLTGEDCSTPQTTSQPNPPSNIDIRPITR